MFLGWNLFVSIVASLVFVAVTTAPVRANATPGNICENLFSASLAGPRGARLSIGDLRRAEWSIPLDVEFEISTLTTPQEKLEFVKRRFDETGVSYREMFLTTRFALRSYTAIEILPGRTSQLNRIAEAMVRTYGTALRFDPEVRGSAVAAANYERRQILISNVSAYSGRPDLSLFHEIRHIAMSAKEANGQPPLANGILVRPLGRLLRLGKSNVNGYEKLLSIQELSTWFQGFRYEVLAYKDLLAQPRLTEHDLVRFFAKLRTVGSQPVAVFEDVIDIATSTGRSTVEGRGFFLYDSERDTVGFMHISLLGGVRLFDIPRPIFEAHLPPEVKNAALSSRGPYFDSELGSATMRAMGVSYFKALSTEAKSHRDHVLDLMSLQAKFERAQSAFFDSRPHPKPAQQDAFFRDFLRRHVAAKNLEG